MDIKLFITDIDGVWTDGGMYYDNAGNELKKFNTSDSAGVLLLKVLNIPVAIISGEDTDIVRKRASKLRIEHVFLGIKDKLSVAQDLCKKLNIDMNEIAYIGDDLNDLKLLNAAKLSACPNDAPTYIKKHVDMILYKKGGEGVFREFVETTLEENNLLEKAIEKVIENYT